MRVVLFLAWLLLLLGPSLGQAQDKTLATWTQWRGPTRDGLAPGANWPDSLSETVLNRLWRVELAPSYSGPIVSESAVFVTGTVEKKTEVVIALDRKSGKVLWRAEWPGAVSVPFF